MKWPPILSILLTALLLLPFDVAHAHAHDAHLPPRASKPNLPDCAALEKLNNTLTRISPVLERVLQLRGDSHIHAHAHAHGHAHGHGSSHAHTNGIRATKTKRGAHRIRSGYGNGEISEQNDKIEEVKGAMERSRKKVSVGMIRCRGLKGGVENRNGTSLEGMRKRRRLRKRVGKGDESESDSSSSSSSDSDSDSDSDDEDKKDNGQCNLMDVLEKLVISLECLVAFAGGVLDGVLELVLNMLSGVIDLVEGSFDW